MIEGTWVVADLSVRVTVNGSYDTAFLTAVSSMSFPGRALPANWLKFGVPEEVGEEQKKLVFPEIRKDQSVETEVGRFPYFLRRRKKAAERRRPIPSPVLGSGT